MFVFHQQQCSTEMFKIGTATEEAKVKLKILAETFERLVL